MMKRITLLGALCAIAGPVLAQTTLIECRLLVDTARGEVLAEQSITVRDGVITAVGESESIQAQAGAIDQRHRLDTCLPGLMDMHVHLKHQNSPDHYIKRFVRGEAENALRAAHFARVTLLAGFTTVRDMGDGYYETLALRDAIAEGIAVGPRIFAVGRSVATTGGHADPTNGYRRDLMGAPTPAEGVINSPDEAREAVRYRYKVGADAIKITATGGVLSLAKSGQNPQFTQDELDALVSTAGEYGMHVAAHAHGTEGMRRAVQAGVRSIEHGTYLDETVMDMMTERGTYLVPTLLAGKFVGDKAREEGYFPAVVAAKAATIGPLMNDTFRRAVEAGVKIAFGTDSGVSPHGENAQEFMLMVKAGMPVMDAIRSATVTAAELLGEHERLGRIAPGYHADIIALAGDPLEDPRRLQDVRFVMKAGEVYAHRPD